MLGHSPFVLALHPGVPAQSVQELIALARAKPRMLNYASAGPATLAHPAGARAYPRGQAARIGGDRRGPQSDPARRAHHRRIGPPRLRMLVVAGDRRAGRY